MSQELNNFLKRLEIPGIKDASKSLDKHDLDETHDGEIPIEFQERIELYRDYDQTRINTGADETAFWISFLTNQLGIPEEEAQLIGKEPNLAYFFVDPNNADDAFILSYNAKNQTIKQHIINLGNE